MDTSTAVMMVAAVVTLAAVYWKSPAAASSGLSATGALILEIIPRMVAAFTLAGSDSSNRSSRIDRQMDGAGIRREGHTDRHDSRKSDSRRAHDSLSDYRLAL